MPCGNPAKVDDSARDAAPAVVGLVLAAGAGRRMGGPKALIGPLADGVRTPLARVCDWVHEAGCARVIAVIGAESDAVRAALAADPMWSRGAPLRGVSSDIPDSSSRSTGSSLHDVPSSAPSWLTLAEASDWAEGMGASLRAGLRAAAASDATVALVTLVDLPDVRTPVYRRVLETLPGRGGAAVLARASYGGHPGHPALIGRDRWPTVIASAVGDRGAREVFARTPHDLIECGDLANGVDADRPNP